MGAACSDPHNGAACRCAACGDDAPKGPDGKEPVYRVALAATRLGPSILGLQAYHTSILVDGVEYYFSSSGVKSTLNCGSHRPLRHQPRILPMGQTAISGEEMRAVVSSAFRAGSYDVLRKNCNSFSDCALYYLLGIRLCWSYKGLEQVGVAVNERNSDVLRGFLQALGMGGYVPNPEADDFDLSVSIRVLSKQREVRLHLLHSNQFNEEVVTQL